MTGYRAPDRIRVAVYVRVSTDDDEQLGSFESQKNIMKRRSTPKKNGSWQESLRMRRSPVQK